MISASFKSIEEFSSFTSNMSGIAVWTDFERINNTHYWSAAKQVLIKPQTQLYNSDIQEVPRQEVYSTNNCNFFAFYDTNCTLETWQKIL